VLLTLLLAACQEPFAEDRRDLASFRIVGVQARAGSGGLDLRAFVWSGHGLWHPAPPEVVWTAGELTATGPTATLPVAPPVDIELRASDGEHEEHAVLALDAPPVPPVVESWVRGTTELEASDVVAPIDERRAAPVGADVPVAPDGALRLALSLQEDGATTHWMATDGTFAELDATSTDWFASRVVLDDNEVESSTPVDEGVVSTVALVFDGAGGNSWITLDAAVAVLGPRLYTAGRVFPVDATPGGEFWSFTVGTSETVAGIELLDLAPAEDASASEAACGLEAGVSFDFAALAEGWCARDDLVGARLVARGEVLP